jgi:hypothetical protein
MKKGGKAPMTDKKHPLLNRPLGLLNPKSDGVFKRIFCQHLPLIKRFLNGTLSLAQGHPIESLVSLPHKQSAQAPTMKNTIMGMKCTDQRSAIFIRKMEVSLNKGFMKDLLFGSSKALTMASPQQSPDFHPGTLNI